MHITISEKNIILIYMYLLERDFSVVSIVVFELYITYFFFHETLYFTRISPVEDTIYKHTTHMHIQPGPVITTVRDYSFRAARHGTGFESATRRAENQSHSHLAKTCCEIYNLIYI